MLALIKKEFLGFFSSFLGVGLMLILFITLSLFTWFFEGNLLDFGFAEMNVFFDILPWFFLLFIPALTMRLFAEEKENNALDLIKILPVSAEKIVIGKIIGAFAVIVIILVPTLLYVFSIKLLSVAHEIDYSIVIGQYLSILLLTFTFVQSSTLSSMFTSKQSLAFVLSLVVNYLLWEGALQIDSVIHLSIFDLSFISLKSHFYNLSQGVIRFSEILFFVGLNVIIYALQVIKFNKGTR